MTTYIQEESRQNLTAGWLPLQQSAGLSKRPSNSQRRSPSKIQVASPHGGNQSGLASQRRTSLRTQVALLPGETTPGPAFNPAHPCAQPNMALPLPPSAFSAAGLASAQDYLQHPEQGPDLRADLHQAQPCMQPPSAAQNTLLAGRPRLHRVSSRAWGRTSEAC